MGLGVHGSSAPSNTYHTPHLHLGVSLGFHGSTAPENTYYTAHLGVLILGIGLGFHGSTAPNTYYTHLHATFRVFNVGIDLGFHVCTAPFKARCLGFYILGIGLGILRRLPSLFRSRGKRRSLAV